VSPDMVVAEADPQRPTIPLAIAEIRLRSIDGEAVWAWDVLDVRDPAFPRYEVRKVSEAGGFGEDVTVKVLGVNDGKKNPADPEWSGANYPYRRTSNDAPILPGVLYHASQYGDRIFDPYFGVELYEGSLSLSVYYSFLAHCLRDASFPQRYAIGVRVAGTEMTDGLTRGARVEVVTDPTTILMLDAATESQPTVGQFQAGADVATLESTIAAIAHRLATDAGLSQTDIQRTSGSAKSGYAISLSNEGKRMAQRRYVVQFRGTDEELVAKSAILFNRATGSAFPEGGYSVLYREVPLSPEELDARRKHAMEMLEAGLMDRVEALRLFGNLSEPDAIAKLALIETMKATTSTGAATMTSVEQTPSPAPVVTNDGHAGAMDDAVEELDAATAALQALASTTRDAASREVLRAVLESLAEAKGYLTGEEVEAVTELAGEEEDVAEEEVVAPIEGAAPEESITAAAAATGQPASSVALNGAQVQAAQGIITSVSKGELPRATGVEMLVQFFNMAPEAADNLMGTVGGSFSPPVAPE